MPEVRQLENDPKQITFSFNSAALKSRPGPLSSQMMAAAPPARNATASIALMVGTGIVYQQMTFIYSADLGYNRSLQRQRANL